MTTRYGGMWIVRDRERQKHQQHDGIYMRDDGIRHNRRLQFCHCIRDMQKACEDVMAKCGWGWGCHQDVQYVCGCRAADLVAQTDLTGRF